MVYALKASDVASVMVNGKLIVRDRRVLTIDAAQVIAKAREFGERIRADTPGAR